MLYKQLLYDRRERIPHILEDGSNVKQNPNYIYPRFDDDYLTDFRYNEKFFMYRQFSLVSYP